MISHSLYAAEQPSIKQLEQVRRDIGKLQQDLGGDKKKQQQYQQELGKLEKEIARIASERRRITTELKQQQREQKQLTAEVQSQREALVERQNDLQQLVRAGYSAGQQQVMKMLLNQGNPAALGRNMTYYGYMSSAQASAVEDVRESLENLNENEAKLKKSTARLRGLQSDLEQQSGLLQERQAQRGLVLTKLNAEISTKEKKLSRLQEDAKSLSRLLEDLDQGDLQSGVLVDLSGHRGKLKWPIKGRLLNRFGDSRHQGGLRWQGIVIRGQEGQDIHAIAPGKVVFADWIRGYGLLLIVDHGNGYMSLYGQNQALYKDVGDAVSGDDVIATLGNSGGKDEFSLYFEMRHKGKPVDPATWCR